MLRPSLPDLDHPHQSETVDRLRQLFEPIERSRAHEARREDPPLRDTAFEARPEEDEEMRIAKLEAEVAMLKALLRSEKRELEAVRTRLTTAESERDRWASQAGLLAVAFSRASASASQR